MRQSPAKRILLLIKTEGPQLAATLAARLAYFLGSSSPAVDEDGGGGACRGGERSCSRQGSTAAAVEPDGCRQSDLPRWHAELTATILSTLVAQLGRPALDAVISAREADTLKRYREEVDAADVQSRVQQLATVRTSEGYMADSWQEADGSLLLVENHCSICAAASVCAGFCRSELETFRAVLGAKVEREEHILLGARRCAYRITPALTDIGARRTRRKAIALSTRLAMRDASAYTIRTMP